MDLLRLFKALIYSWEGFKAGVKHEVAFCQEVVLAVILIPLAFYFDVTVLERALMLGAVFLVLIVELLNSAIECVVDRISLEYHELSKRAKDYGSTAVLFALINCIVIWLSILINFW
ncbi:MAG: diacylglycerol kinase [Deltaproteobacteria bacterium]|jgi:diacylglycerol kinase (ATP)|nr:diacylglycerol kinase [Deltaproteobacteria bacterium]